jgi:hypothetical protein
MKLMDIETLCQLAHRMLASKMFPYEPEIGRLIIFGQIKKK